MSLPPYLVIEGNIGAGKTTFARMLAAGSDSRLILEEFSDNPFLPLFYEDPKRYAFPVELFFMAERHQQMQSELGRTELFRSSVVSDYVFVKTLLFARNSLNAQEFRLFRRLFTALDTNFPAPDLIVYLHRPIASLQANIAKRGRSYERSITDEYLQSLQDAYLRYFRTQTKQAVVTIDVGDLDFQADTEVYNRMLEAIGEPYRPGIRHIDLLS